MPPPMPPPPTAQIAVLHDVRAVHDCAHIDWSQFIVGGQPTWMVIDIIPGANSGSATIPGAHIQAETGQLVTPSGGQTVTVREGEWKLLSSARQADRSSGQYSWTEPILEKRMLAPENYYSPFIHGGRILCSRAAGTTGIQQFGPVVLLPEHFDRLIAPAFSLIKQTPAQVTGWLGQDNDLLAAQAFRTLLQESRIPTVTVRAAVSRAQGYRLSLFIYLLLTARAPEWGLIEELLTGVRERNDPTALRMAVLGSLSAVQLGHPKAAPPGKILKVWLGAQFDAPKVPRGKDAYLDEVLKLSGISR